MNYSFRILEHIPQATLVHHVDAEGGLWATHKRRVLHKESGREWRRVADLPFSAPRDLLAFMRITSRMTRADKCNVYVNRLGKVLAIRAGWVYALEEGRAWRLFAIRGECALHRSIAEDDDGRIYFGEYFMNPERKAVRIWAVAPLLDAWEPAAQLEGIRHVHGVYRDPFEPTHFWVTVGDFAGECYLLRSADRLRNFERFGDGSQTWRAVNLFFTPDHVAWLTDSNLARNRACRMERRSAKLEIGQTLDASVWYGCSTLEGLHVAFTTIEHGPAILSDASQVLVSEDAFHWESVYTFKKDMWRPVKVFKYGVITCPSGRAQADRLYLSGEGLVGLDGVSLRAAIVREGV